MGGIGASLTRMGFRGISIVQSNDEVTTKEYG